MRLTRRELVVMHAQVKAERIAVAYRYSRERRDFEALCQIEKGLTELICLTPDAVAEQTP